MFETTNQYICIYIYMYDRKWCIPSKMENGYLTLYTVTNFLGYVFLWGKDDESLDLGVPYFQRTPYHRERDRERETGGK